MYAKNPIYDIKKPPLNHEWLMAMMPKVGDRRMERPVSDETTGSLMRKEKQPCTVVLVHPEHLWYMVQFDNGFRECYKVPEYVTSKEWRNFD